MRKILYFYLTITLVSCSGSYDLNWLSNEQLDKLLDIIESNETGFDNIHIMYSEVYNDSTYVIEVWQNSVKVNNLDLVLKKQTINSKDIYFYSKEIQSSFDSNSPFFVPDSPYWKVLMEIRNGQTRYFRIDYFEVPLDLIQLNEEDVY